MVNGRKKKKNNTARRQKSRDDEETRARAAVYLLLVCDEPRDNGVIQTTNDHDVYHSVKWLRNIYTKGVTRAPNSRRYDDDWYFPVREMNGFVMLVGSVFIVNALVGV